MKVYFATRARGFFRQLFNAKSLIAKFVYDQSQIYETNSTITKIKNKIGRSPIFDLLGIIHVIKCKDRNEVIYGSFNRFLKSDKPYFIYVENPTALYHYRLNRKKSWLGNRNINKAINSSSLKALVFMSKACSDTFEKVCAPIPKGCLHQVIYPYIPLNPYVNNGFIQLKCIEPELQLLYIAQGERFLSKGGLEVVSAFKALRKKGLSLSIQIITSISDIDSKIIDQITCIDGITLHDFKFSFTEMQEIYAKSHILLQPTSDDSFGLTILEGIKSGLPIIASRLYAIPEIVMDGVNGMLCDPHYWFFDKNNIPNPIIWNNRNKTIYSGMISPEIISYLTNSIEKLYHNRSLLTSMSIASFELAQKKPFSEEYIVGQWNRLLKKITNSAE